MYGLLILALPQSPYAHFSAMTEERFAELLPQFQKDLEADIFPNVCFQGAFNVSNTRTISPLFIPCNGLVAAQELARDQIRNLIANPEREIQHITNIGDWLGVPGKVMFSDNDDGVIVTDMYKYLVHEGKVRLPFRFCPVDLSIIDETPIPSHLYPRDNFYDQVYRDQGGKRTFLKYEPRTDGSRDTTHGEDHHAAKAVLVNGLTYPTLTSAAIAYNLPEGTVFNRLNSEADKWVNWQYAEGKPLV